MTSLPWNQPWPSCWPPCVYGPFSFKSPKLRLASWTLQPGEQASLLTCKSPELRPGRRLHPGPCSLERLLSTHGGSGARPGILGGGWTRCPPSPGDDRLLPGGTACPALLPPAPTPQEEGSLAFLTASLRMH